MEVVRGNSMAMINTKIDEFILPNNVLGDKARNTF